MDKFILCFKANATGQVGYRTCLDARIHKIYRVSEEVGLKVSMSYMWTTRPEFQENKVLIICKIRSKL